MYTVKGELEFDVRKATAGARLATNSFGDMGRSADRAGDFVDRLAKRLFGARTPADYLAKSLARIGPSLLGGAIGGTAIGAIVSQAKEAVVEMNKLADSLDKAIGIKAQGDIGGTASKIGELTNAISDSAEKIRKQGLIVDIAAFFMNEDADRAAKSFAKAVDERIKLGDLLVRQTAEQNAQSQISSELEGKLGEIYKINTAYRKRLIEISDMKGINDSQKESLKLLAEEKRAQETRLVLIKEMREEDKKAAEERKKSAENLASVLEKFQNNLIKKEEDLYKESVDSFKKSQEEKAKAAEEASKRIAGASQNAAEQIRRQDEAASARAAEAGGIEDIILKSSSPGRQALNVARGQRATQISREDFRYQEKLLQSEAERLSKNEGRTLTKQDIRNRLARTAAARQAPSLEERIIGPMQGMEPSQLAASRAQEQMAKQGKGLPDLISAVEKLISKIDTAPLVTSGAGK